MTKTLVLVRHGHRDIDADERDNGLTPRGLAQAHAVADFFRARFPVGAPGMALISSPKRRARETFAPLAEATGLDVTIDEKVDEASVRETNSEFTDRVTRFIRDWQSSRARVTMVCSHNDWIPRATHALIGHALDVPNGSWFEIEWRGGPAELAWYVPSFAPFPTRS